MNFGFDPSTIALILGGALGAFAHAVFGKDYSWRSKCTAWDVLCGAALGIVVPIVPIPKLLALLGVDFELPAAAMVLTPAQKGAGMMFMSYALLDVIRDKLLNRFQTMAPTQNRRAADRPTEPPKPEVPK